MGKILINVRILQDPFLIRVFFIRVNHEAQDISLHIYSWAPSKNHVGTVKRPFYYRQLSITSRWSGRQVESRQLKGRVIIFSIVKLMGPRLVSL